MSTDINICSYYSSKWNKLWAAVQWQLCEKVNSFDDVKRQAQNSVQSAE